MKWSKVIRENEEQIKEAMREVYEKAQTDSCTDFRRIEYAIIDTDANIHYGHHASSSETSGAVWNGEAIYITAHEEFTPWEYDVEGTWIEPVLTPAEKVSFERWLTQDGNWVWDGNMTFRSLEEWNQEVYERIVAESFDADMEDYTSCRLDSEYADLLKKIES